MSVRRLRAADVQDYRMIRLLALRTDAASFSATHEAEAAMPIDIHAERLGSSIVFGAYDDGRIAGMIGLRREERPSTRHKGLVWGFFVAPGHRRSGMGTALMSAAIDAAGETVEQVLLSVVDGNAAATAFYERFGFRRYGIEPRALKRAGDYADESLMILFIEAPAALSPSAPGGG